MKLWDISPPISEALAVWPGDTPPRREILQRLERGDAVTLSTLHATVHLGAHADAPSHYGRGAAAIEAQPLERYLGPAEVVRVAGRPGVPLGAEALPREPRAERVLLATGPYPDFQHFHEDFAPLTPALVARLARAGVRLVGVDTPSVDAFDSKDLPAHHACLAHDVLILEGLVLRDVPEGLYELIALPLKLVGFDGSPVRAVLRER
jgi:arylformamidase